MNIDNEEKYIESGYEHLVFNVSCGENFKVRGRKLLATVEQVVSMIRNDFNLDETYTFINQNNKDLTKNNPNGRFAFKKQLIYDNMTITTFIAEDYEIPFDEKHLKKKKKKKEE